MNTQTFTQRRLEKITIERVDYEPENNYAALTTTEHSGFCIPTHVAPAISAGEEIFVEFYNFNDIGGLIRPNGEYLFHRSDEYFAKRFEEWKKDQAIKREKYYRENKEDWARRTDALEPRYKNRMLRFLSESDEDVDGENFRTEPMGWGYELVICELAQAYERSGGVDNEEVVEMSRRYGTSGNQHNVAKSWAKHPEAAI